jgi:hypothetical protein
LKRVIVAWGSQNTGDLVRLWSGKTVRGDFFADHTVTYLSRLAEQAASDHAHREAVLALQDALHHAERLPADATRDRLVVELRLHLAHSLFALGRCQDVLDLIDQQQDRLEHLQDAHLSGRYALLCSQAHSNLGQWDQSAQQAQNAIKVARSC